MVSSNLPPRNSNDFIEQQLDIRLEGLERAFDSHALSYWGDLLLGADDLIRDAVEGMRDRNQKSDKLTVILTTPGGYIEVVQRIVETLRHHYKYVSFVVPNYAFSAGTVLVMSGDAIYMNYYSRLGPIDPQVETASGRQVSALGYLAQWESLMEKAKAGTILPIEVQLMLTRFDMAELYEYEQARDLSVDLLKDWLVKYKFKDWDVTETSRTPVTPAMKEQRAEEIAKSLNDTKKWRSHGRGISMEVLERDLHLKVDDFGADEEKSRCIKDYSTLVEDYMMRRGNTGVIHTIGGYIPIA